MYLKKFFIIGSFIFILTVLLGPAKSFSQNAADEEGSGVGVISAFGSGAYDALLPSDLGRLLFGGDKPKNIYAFMYDQAKFKPERVAVQRIIAEETALNEDDLQALRGRLSRLYGFIPEGAQPIGEQPTQAQIRQRHVQLNDLFDTERDIAGFQAEIESEIFVSEIFADGDRDNSGFDLLYDLDIIEAILFGKEVTQFGASGPGAPAGARRVDVRAGGDEADGEAEGDGVARAGAGRRAGDGAGDGSSPPPIPGGEQGIADNPTFSPAMCSADSSLDSSIRDFLQKEQSGEILGPESLSGRAEARRNQGSLFGTGENGSDDENLTAEQKRERIFTPDHAGNFQRARQCFGPFCLEVKARYKKESSYLPTASCIACHIEKMNDAFNKTLKQNLIPGKVTGNVLEPSFCKDINIGDIVGINFVLIPSPIVTPPNDDIVVKADVFQAFIKYDEQYRPFLIDQVLQAIGVAESPEEANRPNRQLPSVEARAGQSASASASSNTTAQEVTRNIRAYTNSARNAQLRTLEETSAQSSAENIVQEYQALSIEMEQFNTYFRNLQQIFKNMKTPCNTLLNKAYCS